MSSHCMMGHSSGLVYSFAIYVHLYVYMHTRVSVYMENKIWENLTVLKTHCPWNVDRRPLAHCERLFHKWDHSSTPLKAEDLSSSSCLISRTESPQCCPHWLFWIHFRALHEPQKRDLLVPLLPQWQKSQYIFGLMLHQFSCFHPSILLPITTVTPCCMLDSVVLSSLPRVLISLHHMGQYCCHF